jgi:hypothetical protein
MKNLDDFIGENSKNSIDFSCQCTSCHGTNTKVYKSEDTDTFSAKCDDCGNKFYFKLPGMGAAF